MSTSSNTERLQQLLEKQKWTEEERRWLLDFLNSTDQVELRQLMQEKFDKDSFQKQPDAKAEYLLVMIHKRIDSQKNSGKLLHLKGWKQMIAAASILLALSVGLVYFSLSVEEQPAFVAESKQETLKDIAPGYDNAILTLSDGTTIMLDSAADGVIAKEGTSEVLKINGHIAYRNLGGEAAVGKPVYNTISTVNGNQYKLVLSDGSKVWLNATSSIRFPVAFTAKERRVQISGEAYFEVAQSSDNEARKVPFIVQVKTASVDSKGYEVQVLGTHFNINAYSDEPTLRTTLAEGKVKVNIGSRSVLLNPSQQAVLNVENQQFNVQTVDVGEAIAWKMGMFEFNDANLHSIMRQLARWYDVDVTFSGPVSNKLYNGSIRRQATLSQVLQILKLAGVNYTLKERALVIGAN